MKTFGLVALSSLVSLWIAGCAADASSPASEPAEDAVVTPPPDEKAAPGIGVETPIAKADESNDLSQHTIQFRAERKIYITASGRAEK